MNDAKPVIESATVGDLLHEEFLDKTGSEKMAERLTCAALYFADKNKSRSEEK